MSNIDRQNDELEALSYLIPEGHFTVVSSHSTPPLPTFQFKFHDEDFSSSDSQYCPLILTISLPSGYPDSKPPILVKYDYEPCRLKLLPEKLASTGWFELCNQRQLQSHLTSELWNGEEVLFDLYQYLVSSLQYPTQGNGEYQNNSDLKNDLDDDPNTPSPIPHSTNSTPLNTINTRNNSAETGSIMTALQGSNEEGNGTNRQLYVGARPYKTPSTHHTKQQVFELLENKYKMTQLEHFVVQKSTFITRAFPIKDYSTCVEILTLLYCLKEVSTATHTMVVYRYTTLSPTPDSNTSKGTKAQLKVVLGADEDGEDGAEKVQLNVMQNYDCCCLVTVTRQFGGILLGPSRFKIIADLTREVLETAGYKRLEGKKK